MFTDKKKHSVCKFPFFTRRFLTNNFHFCKKLRMGVGIKNVFQLKRSYAHSATFQNMSNHLQILSTADMLRSHWKGLFLFLFFYTHTKWINTRRGQDYLRLKDIIVSVRAILSRLFQFFLHQDTKIISTTTEVHNLFKGAIYNHENNVNNH